MKPLILFIGLLFLAKNQEPNPLPVKVDIWSGANDNVVLKDLRTGKSVRFSELKGKALFINFWDSG